MLLRYLPLLLLPMCAALLSAADRTDVTERMAAMPPAHPRLLLTLSGESAFQQRIASTPLLSSIAEALRAQADRMLSTRPVERIVEGKRLLDKSRTAFSRTLHLGLAWRLTGRKAYLDRVREELIAISNFSDWHPQHFLDVAEMTAAAAIGYDWCYDGLDEETRALVRSAIVEKGLRASIKNSGWSRLNSNWNQVCNAGITLGALAVAESEPELAASLVSRAVTTLPIVMHEYGPDGAYPEGPTYWSYGTTYNVLLIAALESALGTDFGLANQPGFLATADYYLQVIGPSGLAFNYSDAHRGQDDLESAMFWFARKRGDSSILWNQWPLLQSRLSSRTWIEKPITEPLPFLLLWMPDAPATPDVPQALSWTGRGLTPVAFHRSSWDANAAFVAIKGGTPSINHGHMDVGAFVMDVDGVRWADDLGLQNYHSLESKGVNLWEKGQDAERWKVFRLSTAAHNVPMVDGQQQRVAGNAPIVSSGRGRTVVDLTDIYEGQLASAKRGVALESDRSVRVQDEYTAPDRPVRVRWAMVTSADVSIDGPGKATLSQSGRTLSFQVCEPLDAKLVIFPTDPPPSPFDARNEGTRMIGFETRLEARHHQRVIVQLAPAEANPSPYQSIPLSDWQ